MMLTAWIVLMCVVFTFSQDVQPQCSSPTFQVKLNTRQNQTGHWLTEVKIKNEHTDAKGLPGWHMEVDQQNNDCRTDKSILETTILLTAPPAAKTLKDYEFFPGVGTYKFHSKPTTWPVALQTCANEGAHLAVINSEKEADVMKALFGRYPTISAASNNDWAWIGLHRIGNDFFTVFGDTLSSTGFQRWGPSEPHKGDQYCGLVNRAHGGMADHLCDWKVAFICER